MATIIKKENPMSRMTRKELYEKCKKQQEEIQKLNLFQEHGLENDIETKWSKLKQLNEEVWKDRCRMKDEVDRLQALLQTQHDKALAIMDKYEKHIIMTKALLEDTTAK